MLVHSAQFQTGATGNATWKAGGHSAAQVPQITKETHAHTEPYCHTQPGSTGDQVDCFILQAIVSQTCCRISCWWMASKLSRLGGKGKGKRKPQNILVLMNSWEYRDREQDFFCSCKARYVTYETGPLSSLPDKLTTGWRIHMTTSNFSH